MSQPELLEAWQSFMITAQPYVNIDNEQTYNDTLETLEQVLKCADDSEDDPLNPLIDVLSNAIAKYEAKDEALMAFVKEAQAIPADLALLRTLMRQHQLTGSDLPEIGDKTMVSKVLNGQRRLNRNAIEKLSLRFGLSPALFFDAAC